jgi:GMP synthase (glutamine-hydrolysing)
MRVGNMITIVDNGSQYTHLIKRNCRDFGLECSVVQNTLGMDGVAVSEKDMVILSGGPSSVYAPGEDRRLGFALVRAKWEGKIGAKILGICFGQQTIAHALGGKVEKGKSAEYGLAEITVDREGALLRGVPGKFKAWVSHFDEVKEPPAGFSVLAHSATCGCEAMECPEKGIYSVQFHPEVWHTEHGERILENFLKI